jgi:hypothetical protein
MLDSKTKTIAKIFIHDQWMPFSFLTTLGLGAYALWDNSWPLFVFGGLPFTVLLLYRVMRAYLILRHKSVCLGSIHFISAETVDFKTKGTLARYYIKYYYKEVRYITMLAYKINSFSDNSTVELFIDPRNPGRFVVYDIYDPLAVA